MKIVKKFRVESAHIVRNCTSERCSHSIHGHSAVIEIQLESDKLDNAQMVYDFGLMKNSIKDFIDSMDHSYLLCKSDNDEFKSLIKRSCDRWIELPFNPSAEMLSLWILNEVNFILCNTEKNNGEGRVRCTQVRYWETETGSAIAELNDLDNLWNENYDVNYSDNIVKDWGKDLSDLPNKIINPKVEQQIKLK